MKELQLIRTAHSPFFTRGVLIIGNEAFQTIERPDKGNARNVSCIPKGEYYGKFLKRSASGRWRNVYHILDVPDRTGIFIHAGNLVEQTYGCILPGMSRGLLGGKEAVLNSGAAMRRIRAALGEEHFKIRIT